MSTTTSVKSAGRILGILDLIAENGPLTFSEVVDTLDLPQSSTHNLIQTLLTEAWLEKDPLTRRLHIGLRAWRVAQAYEGHRTLVDLARPVMDALAVQVGETVQLARLDGAENVYIAISHPPNPMRLASRVGMRLPAHATGIGKSLLATLPPTDARKRLEESSLARFTVHTITEVDELMAAITQVASCGYSTDDEEYVEGCCCVAVPVTSQEEIGIPSGMSITLPRMRRTHPWPGELLERLTEARQTIRARLALPYHLPLPSPASRSGPSVCEARSVAGPLG
jgi:IclR family acetate operon transcriptional repressor